MDLIEVGDRIMPFAEMKDVRKRGISDLNKEEMEALEGLFEQQNKYFGGEEGEGKKILRGAKLEEEQVRNAQNAKEVEKRRIHEKQIRGLRNQYSGVGLMNNTALGGQGELPSKLGQG